MAATAAVIEIVERHNHAWPPPADPANVDGAPAPIIVPNLLRINGHDIWSAKDHPVQVGPIRLDMLGHEASVVPVTMLAHLTDGIYDKPAGGPPAVEVTIAGDEVTVAGEPVLVDEGGARILHRHLGTNYARVRLDLFARRLVVDYEENPKGWPDILRDWYPSEPGVIPPSVESAEMLLALARIRAASGPRAEWDPADAALAEKLWALQRVGKAVAVPTA